MNDIAHCQRSSSADTARAFGSMLRHEPQFWINLQANYDLDVALDALASFIESQVKPRGRIERSRAGIQKLVTGVFC